MSVMTATILLFAVSGIAFGSFGNVLVYRIHAQKPITGRSVCPRCHRTLSWFELIPVFSFLVLRRRCRTCHHPISLQYPLVELGSGMLFVVALALHPSAPIDALLTAFILYFLFLSCVFDAQYQQVPDVFTLLIALCALLWSVLHETIVSSMLGAFVMLVWFGGQWMLSRGKSVGTGDIFLAIALGFWLGSLYALMTIVFSYMAGAGIVITMLLLKKIHMKQQRIAYVPFLMIGVMLTILGFGDAYLRVLGLM